MNVTPYKTHKIQPNENLYEILDKYLPQLQENSIVAIASKIVGICEGRVIKHISDEQKNELAKKEADFYLPKEYNQYGFLLTIKHNLIVASAGIDESNSNGYLSLWPKDPQKSVNAIRKYLIKKYHLNHIGIILIDSKLSPLRWGVTGYTLAYSGFQTLNSYIGRPDIFGKIMKAEQTNVADSLSAAAAVVMGEGNEQQPLAVITDMSFIHFQKRNPTKEELEALKITIGDDIYSSLLTSVKWKKGGE